MGNTFLRGSKLERAHVAGSRGMHEWHVALNGRDIDDMAPHWMYTAKMISDEVPRMVILFEMERRGMPTIYKACAHDPRPPTPLPDNHLRCALNVECRKCPFLARIEAHPAMTNEEKDEAKAWTCATHVLLESKADDYMEQVLSDKSDAAFEERMADSFASTANGEQT